MEQSKKSVAHALLGALNGAVARLVALDPATGERLKALDGRKIALHLNSPEWRMQLHLQAGSFVLVPATDKADDAPDLSLKTTAGALLGALANRITHGKTGGLPAGKLHISGDAELARQMQLIAGQFAPDWDAPFVHAFGDVIGFQLARGARKFAGWAQRSAEHVLRSSSEYVREESRDTIAPGELDTFLDDVDNLRDRADRLEMRVQRLLASKAQVRRAQA
jgi:ubiquinone biosynthesis accessory factor UbiJ